MNYFKLVGFAAFFIVLTSACFAMDAPEQERDVVRISFHSLPHMSDINKYLGKETAPETKQKRARVDDRDSASHEEDDLNESLIVLDFDEALGNFVYTGLGPDFARDCRAFSCEMFREDEMAFYRASKILGISVADYKSARDEWTRSLMGSCEYTLLESSTKDLLLNLRKRGATLLVCSGNENNPWRTSFLKSLGFNGETDYFYEPEDKTRPVIDLLKKKRFSKVLFVDNRSQNVEDFLRRLAAALAPSQTQDIEITGLHYGLFHETVTHELLADQYRQLQARLAIEKEAVAISHKEWLEGIQKLNVRDQKDK